jgi:hypothetical protein
MPSALIQNETLNQWQLTAQIRNLDGFLFVRAIA